MHASLNVLAFIAGLAGLAAMLFYGSFARNWRRTLAVTWALMFVHSSLRVFCILEFREFCPPLGGYLFLPFMAAGLSLLLRIVKVGLADEIPALARLDKRIRSHWEKARTKSENES